MLQEPARGPSAALAKATAAGTQIDRVPSAKAAIASAFAEGAFTDNNTADATNITVIGADPTATGANPTATTAEATTSPAEHTAAKQVEVQQHQQLNAIRQTSFAAKGASTETEVDQLRRQLLESWQSQAAVEASFAACEAQNSDLQRQLELRQKSQTAAVATAMALGGKALQLQRQLKAAKAKAKAAKAKAKEAAAEARAAAAEHAVLQLKFVGQMVLDLHKVRSSSSVLVDALARGVAALRCIMIYLICSAKS